MLIFHNTGKWHFRNLLPETGCGGSTSHASESSNLLPTQLGGSGKTVYPRGRGEARELAFHILILQERLLWSWDFPKQQTGQQRDRCRTLLLMASLFFFIFRSCQVCRHRPLTPRKWVLNRCSCSQQQMGCCCLKGSEEFPSETSSHRAFPPLSGSHFLSQTLSSFYRFPSLRTVSTSSILSDQRTLAPPLPTI